MGLPTSAALLAASFLVSLFGCAAIKEVAARLRLVDVPNERSLHKAPVPRLGGVAIVGGVLLGTFGLAAFGDSAWHADMTVWLCTSSLVAGLGLVDDVRPLPALARLLAQTALSAVAVFAVLHHRPSISLAGGMQIPFDGLVAGAAVIFIVGTTNIYNFMDGMDGLAAAQTTSAGIALGAAALAVGELDIGLVAVAIAAATAGFWVHNAPPATLFLGDVGSTFLGFSFALLGIIAATRSPGVPFAIMPVALSPFLMDGTFTLFRRLFRGERIWQAHRSHLYQRAVGTGLTHRDVLVVYAAWSVGAAASAIFAFRGVGSVLGAETAMAGALLLVWRWVHVLEARSRTQ